MDISDFNNLILAFSLLLLHLKTISGDRDYALKRRQDTNLKMTSGSVLHVQLIPGQNVMGNAVFNMFSYKEPSVVY